MTETAKLMQTELDEAWKCIFKRDISIALEHAKKASLIAPQSPDVAHVLGVIACRDDRYDIALPLLQKALDGGVTQRRLRDMAEALLLAGHANAALTPIQDAIRQFGETPETLGLLAAVHAALNAFDQAEMNAKKAVELNPSAMAWDATVAFCKLMNVDIHAGFKWFTGRSENLPATSRCPTLNKLSPCDIWLKNEQGPGDTLFYLRYANYLTDLGFKLHIKTDKKTKALLNSTGIFASVKETLAIPHDGFWLNMGDLPLAAMQLGCEAIAPALPLPLDPKRVEKIKKKLAEFGPAPYVAVTWRAGPRGKLQTNGLRKYNKHVDPAALGKLLTDKSCTVISIQRVPEPDEAAAFKKGLGRDFADCSSLNDQLQDMLALLSVVDLYLTVPNTNVHLRQSLNQDMLVLVNQPWQDWRWLAQGNSPWYPNATVFRQAADSTWQHALNELEPVLTARLSSVNTDLKRVAPIPATPTFPNIDETLMPGWTAINQGKVAEAILVAKQALSLYPNHPEALHLLGWSAHRDLKTELAASVLAQALQFAPEHVGIMSNLVRVLTVLKRYEDATVILDAAFQNQRISAKESLFAARAVLNQQQNRIHESIADYEQTLALNPSSLNVAEHLGMAKLKIGDARAGFRACTARKVARMQERAEGHVCPWLKGDLTGLHVLIKRDMGLGDELTYLRYLPWLTEAGAQVTYWAGKKLAPLLERMALGIEVLSDEQPLPTTDAFDLTIWVNELPVAVEHLDAPEIAPPLALSPRPDLVKKWKQWLAQQGNSPYIGFNWRAGAKAEGTAAIFSKLAKSIDPQMFANSLSGIDGTFISLQRNVFADDIKQFEQHLQHPIHDASAITDDLEDLLALLSLLDENIGVSNTNMHLRAGLGLGSRVLVQCPGGDWRWGFEGSTSLWFAQSDVYRQQLNGDWQVPLQQLNKDLTLDYSQKTSSAPIVKTAGSNQARSVSNRSSNSKRLIWLTAGAIKTVDGKQTSDLASARYRVITPSQALNQLGWQSEIVNEEYSLVMGGWGSATPQAGDTIIISKVFTEHALSLAKDAKGRGARVIVDIRDNLLNDKKRGALQKQLLDICEIAVVATRDIQIAVSQVTNKNVITVNDATEDCDQNAIALAWQNVFQLTAPDKKNKSAKTISHTKTVLVGIMYSGENEYETTKSALKSQNYQHHAMFLVENLPNKLAHDTLYTKFMSLAGEYDYFLKLDADMVFANQNVLAEMVAQMQENDLAHMFAYVKDCPSSLMIPGIQMFRSDTQWHGSDEQLNVDYAPKINGNSKVFCNKDWINHMPDPDEYQLFRYGVHKALKSIQPDRNAKNIKKGILHLTILNGIARSATLNNKHWFALIGALLVYEKAFDTIEYNGDQTKKYFDILKNKPQKFEVLKRKAEEFWSNEVQVNYWWVENFSSFSTQ